MIVFLFWILELAVNLIYVNCTVHKRKEIVLSVTAFFIMRSKWEKIIVIPVEFSYVENIFISATVFLMVRLLKTCHSF